MSEKIELPNPIAYDVGTAEDTKDNNSIVAENVADMSKEWVAEPITADMLPPSISKWVYDICERIESPFEIGAVTALCFIGNLIGSKVTIRPKAYDDWAVTPNLWGMIIGKASVKKSPVYNEIFKSINRIQKTAFSEFEENTQKVDEEHQKIDAQIKQLERVKTQDMDAIIALKNSKPSMPTLKRYTTNDATIEALAKILKDNPNGILSTRDELSGFLKSMDKNGHESDRAFYLEGWNGLGHHTIDRAGNGITYLERLTLGILGAIQPSIIREYVSETVSGKKADGFLQRFQLTIFAEPIEQKYIDRKPNLTARNEFDTIIEHIATAEIFEGAAHDDYDDSKPPFYRFDNDAQKVFIDWYLTNTKEANEASEALSAHLSKYDKLFTSLCLIFHICDIVRGENIDKSRIGLHNAQRALALTNALKSHAYKLYSTFEIEEEKREEIADKIMAYLEDKMLPIGFRDVSRAVSGVKKYQIISAIKGHYSYGGSKIIKRFY